MVEEGTDLLKGGMVDVEVVHNIETALTAYHRKGQPPRIHEICG